MRRDGRGRSGATAAGLAVLAVAAGGALGTPVAAEGGTAPGRVEFPTRCLPSAQGATTARIEVDDPAPKAGDTVTVTYRLDRTPAAAPPEGGLPAATGWVLLGGAQTGEVPVTSVAGASGTVMSGRFTVTGPGGVTLAPGGYVLPGGACAPDGPPPVGRRIAAAPPPPVMNLRGVSLGGPYGEAGARVRVTGAGFTPGAAVTVAGRAGAAETADRAVATADRSGNFAVELAVGDRGTTGVVAYEGRAWTAAGGTRPVAYAVVERAAPAVGALTMTQAGAAITLGAVGYGSGVAVAGRIGTVTVTDTRGAGASRWTLTGKLTGFTGPDGVLVPGASLTWTPSCGGGCAAGPAGAVGPDGAVLASGAGGTSTVDATVTLRVPAYTRPGAYRAALTLTLS